MAKKKKEEPTPTPLNTSGELRLVANRDGWFVVGQGLQFSVEDRTAGLEMIQKLKTTGASK